MKLKFIFLLAFIWLFIKPSNAQLSTLPSGVVNHYKPFGWIYFNSNTAELGDLFTTHYSCFFTDSANTMIMDRDWQDNFLNFKHYHYQQYYEGIPVEGCEFTEHATLMDGKMVYANGKICSQIGKIYDSRYIDEREALENLLEGGEHWDDYIHTFDAWELPIEEYSIGDAFFAWNDSLAEANLKAETGDPNATYYPSGELVFTTKNWRVPIQYDMDEDDYLLAWKFEISAIYPDIYITVWVDAITGDVFKVMDNRHYDGPATIPFYGTVTLDTRYIGGFTNAHVLHTNDAGRDVHTKFNPGAIWGLTGEVEDSDGNWGSTQQTSTAAHWAVTKAWDYFFNVHGRSGIDGNGGKVRVFANSTSVQGAAWEQTGGTSVGLDRIHAGFYSDDGVYSGELSVLAHEYTHGIDHRCGKLYAVNESAALDESFADIFGFMVRRYVTSSMSWEIGVPTTTPRNKRNLQDPSVVGIHWDVVAGAEGQGQPDTYGGTYWLDWQTNGYDQGGAHINNGVQNHWFYMLAMGESGTNDLSDNYVVHGIGVNAAAAIAYYNLTNNMQKNSQYIDAMEGSIDAALYYYGECSFQHIQTQNAWYAAGVGTESSCANAGIDENNVKFQVYPNPTTDFVNITFADASQRTIQIYSISGVKVKEIKNTFSSQYTLDVSNFANGTYLINVIGDEPCRTIFVKK